MNAPKITTEKGVAVDAINAIGSQKLSEFFEEKTVMDLFLALKPMFNLFGAPDSKEQELEAEIERLKEQLQGKNGD